MVKGSVDAAYKLRMVECAELQREVLVGSLVQMKRGVWEWRKQKDDLQGCYGDTESACGRLSSVHVTGVQV